MIKAKIFIVGDSTVSSYNSRFYPQCGWGQTIDQFFNESVQIINKAVPGRSSKSFFDEGRLDEIENAIQPNDFLVIQFGHNDEKDDEVRHTDPKTTFKQYIKRYIFAAERKQALPILITPVERRIFNKDGVAIDSHGDYPSSIRELSETYQLPLVDLQASSKLLYQTMGPEKSKKLFLWFKKDEYSNFPEGSEDNTHFSEYGAKQIARLIVEDLKKTNSPIKQFLKDR